MANSAPLSDAVILAVARLVDDAQVETRSPSHSDLEFQIQRASLRNGDPKAMGQVVGKAKRVRSVLSWALENNQEGGTSFVTALLTLIRSQGGFRDTSPNYCGKEAIGNCVDVFRAEGFTLIPDGTLHPQMLESLSGAALTDALRGYVNRAKQGAGDAALLAGTSKDLLEAVAAHILTERQGSYPRQANFETLLGMAFVALDMWTPAHPILQSEPPTRKIERAMFSLALGINALRNKQGTGHGRPWLPTLSPSQAKQTTQLMGNIVDWMLANHATNCP